jgi:hypothetical protein
MAFLVHGCCPNAAPSAVLGDSFVGLKQRPAGLLPVAEKNDRLPATTLTDLFSV